MATSPPYSASGSRSSNLFWYMARWLPRPAWLEQGLAVLENLQSEASQGLAQELRAAEQRVGELRKAQQKPQKAVRRKQTRR